MSFQEVFPNILAKTYSNCKVYGTLSNNPGIFIRSKIFEDKCVFLPFLDTIFLNQEVKKKELEEMLEKDNNLKIEIRLSESDSNLNKTRKLLKEKGFQENVSKGHIISELTSQEDFWDRFHKHTRNDIRKAEKSNLTILKIDNLTELKRFYLLYLRQMKEFGTPQHSFTFFKNCFGMMLDSFYGLNCYLNDRLIGSIIIFVNKSYAYVSFNV